MPGILNDQLIRPGSACLRASQGCKLPPGHQLSRRALGVAFCSCQPLAPCGMVPGRCVEGSGEPVLVGVGDGLCSVADAGLGEEMIDVAFYCGLADHQPPGDL